MSATTGMGAASGAGPLVVVKLGGRVQADPALPGLLAALWERSGGALVVVHGGGDEVSALQRAFGLETRFVGGRRVTAEADLDLLRMALSGSANKRLVSQLVTAGARAVGVSGEDAGLITAVLPGSELGFVGAAVSADASLVRHLLAGGYLPVVSPVARNRAVGAAGGASAAPAVLNVNGDDAAAALAASLGAAELLLVADVPGVLDGGVPVAELAADAARELIARGVARGGMAAKLDAALTALDRGVPAVRVGDLTLLHAGGAAAGRTGAGTLVVATSADPAALAHTAGSPA